MKTVKDTNIIPFIILIAICTLLWLKSCIQETHINDIEHRMDSIELETQQK